MSYVDTENSCAPTGPGATIVVVRTFADRVRFALRRLGLATLKGEGFNQLDKLAGRPQGSLSRLISRQMDPHLSIAAAYAGALRVRLDWLATGEGPMERDVSDVADVYGELPGWSEAAASVRGVPSYAVDAVAARPVLLRPDAVTSEFVRAIAGFWLSWAPEHEIDAAAKTDIKRRRDGEDDN